jgi:Protein  of unknown function (DUF3018)
MGKLQSKPATPARRMNAYRARMKKAGFRQVQLWLPDTRSPAFIKEIRRQCMAIAANDPAGREIDAWIESVYEWPDL